MTARHAEEGIYRYHITRADEMHLTAHYLDALEHARQAFEAAFRLFQIDERQAENTTNATRHASPLNSADALLRATRALVRQYRVLDDPLAQLDYTKITHDTLLNALMDYDNSKVLRCQCAARIPTTLAMLEEIYEQLGQPSVYLQLYVTAARTLRYFSPRHISLSALPAHDVQQRA